VDPDAVSDGEWGRSRDGCIRWVAIVEGEGAVLGVNFGRHIVTNIGTLLHSCAEVPEPIQLSFGVVSGVGPDIHVLDGGSQLHVPQKEGGRLFGGFFGICAPLI